ncbi:MAG: hypothetical protein A2Z51_08805 [Deltaproteobacteria bacterium RBG_19FT_COMBO_52_11]|nr:MAG: hypothetical protein A2Z51_08805 [Deltaproteobacteria bacterium RBG_19FT_COMBO_52_11]
MFDIESPKRPDEAIESLSRKGIGEPARPDSPIGSSKGSPITRERIITLIAANPQITSDAIASSLGITKRAVLKQIRRLKSIQRNSGTRTARLPCPFTRTSREKVSLMARIAREGWRGMILDW